jgi:hypothetical protein
LLRGGANRPWFIHVHAAVFVGWMALLVTQTALVAAGLVSLHRRVGQAGIAYGVLVLVVGLAVSVAAPVMRVQAGQLPVERGAMVVLYNLTDILTFGGFFAAAVAYRTRSPLHKRLMLSATVALLGAAVGRVLPGGSVSYLLVWLSPLLVSMAVDLWTRRRLYFVSLLSVAVFVTTFFKVDILSWSPLWSRLGRLLIDPWM